MAERPGVSIGTAGWTIPRQVADRFSCEGSSLERYAARFPVAEINSSFHRPHKPATWERWRDSTPAGFRFSVKLAKTITHERKLAGAEPLLDDFLAQATLLGEKLAVILVQLPPKLAFDPALAAAFFAILSPRTGAAIACEPRHPSWFTDAANALLAEHRVARAAADPAVTDTASQPGGWTDLSYWRLHGSPRIYRSSYADRLPGYAEALVAEAAAGHDTWCIFDNTASSAAASDALALGEALGASVRPP